ncbi:protein kinase domain-containing protein [Limnoglobus roseus]|uniref:Tetratricopeptide repeat protein n=1 Tax=Limnoglobus roseus TaxID=2598579 RepID=A0A5C1AT37_9BACT|nr:protein kinase [Limnoglobus roseus]QEL20364.1 tetratricopeptide repeat protein [Limnoglobus roseus]
MTAVSSLSARVEQLADAMVADWEGGTTHPAEQYLNRCPELWQHPDAALELLAEELTLRDERGWPVAAGELEARFPQWQPQVQALLECQQILGPRLSPPQFPQSGETLGGFLLQSELGRGAHGRVYLASQSTLADRPVVLKVSPIAGDEHLSLARLQHTNIVPLYSAEDFPAKRLRALCLPYFGGLTLAEIQSDLQDSAEPLAGRDLLNALPSSPDQHGPTWSYLQEASLTDAVCWIGASLADALQYAHDRGILHLDLKPSNVLIAADGVPMLLDFHLAHPPLAAGSPAPTWLGGTRAYMAPEHCAAVEAVRSSGTIQTPVGPAADVYSLGVMLRDFLRATRCPVSHGLSDVLDRCTAPTLANRYAHAADLAADLRRHLSDLPLKGVTNRSLIESWGKWRRRRPYALPLAFTLAALLVGAGGVVISSVRLSDRAAHALADGRGYLSQHRNAEAAEALRGAEAMIEGLPFQAKVRSEIREARHAADRAVVGENLHAFVEKLRFLAVVDDLLPEQLRKIDRECRTLWDQREKLIAEFGRENPDLLELGILATAVRVRAASPDQNAAAVAESRSALDEMERLFGATPVLDLERARYAGEPNMPPRTAKQPTARTSWDHVWAGRSHLAAGRTDLAVREFDAAVQLDPQLLWANYYHGVALLRADRPADAMAAFTACVALAPQAAWCRFNRALAYGKLDRSDAALADLDAAISLDVSMWSAHWERAAVNLKLQRPKEALADLGRATAAGAPPADTHYRTAVVNVALNDRAAAAAQLRECLRLDSGHAAANQLLQQLGGK